MSSTAFFKRILPFVAALTIGIFITSFFVNVGGQRSKKWGHNKRCINSERLWADVDQLRLENQHLREQLDAVNESSFEPGDHRFAVAPRVGEVPPPPVPAVPRAKN